MGFSEEQLIIVKLIKSRSFSNQKLKLLSVLFKRKDTRYKIVNIR